MCGGRLVLVPLGFRGVGLHRPDCSRCGFACLSNRLTCTLVRTGRIRYQRLRLYRTSKSPGKATSVQHYMRRYLQHPVRPSGGLAGRNEAAQERMQGIVVLGVGVVLDGMHALDERQNGRDMPPRTTRTSNTQHVCTRLSANTARRAATVACPAAWPRIAPCGTAWV